MMDTSTRLGWRFTPGNWIQLERSIMIDAPPDRVFAVVGDVANSPTWAGSGEVQAIQRLTEGPIAVGTTYQADQKVRGMKYSTTSTVVAYEPDRLFVWRVRPPQNGRSEWGFRLEPHGSGTRLTHFYNLDAEPIRLQRLVTKFLFRVLGRVPEIGRHMEQTLANVKKLVEAPIGDQR